MSCTILAFDQSWWTIAGLLLDIAGVLILLRESWLSHSPEGDQSFLGMKVDVYDSMATDVASVKADTQDHIKQELAKVPKELRRHLKPIYDRFIETESETFVESFYRDALREVSDITRHRYFAMAGFFLLAGFILQIVGAVPVCR
ncbi:MAG: hypothetical protein KDJ69_16840 [Nitratireductor sp.]|nr:hypothetical protein [Nitratireductor sp.]